MEMTLKPHGNDTEVAHSHQDTTTGVRPRHTEHNGLMMMMMMMMMMI
jgi:hypothetical protein